MRAAPGKLAATRPDEVEFTSGLLIVEVLSVYSVDQHSTFVARKKRNSAGNKRCHVHHWKKCDKPESSEM